jgi:5'-deoxynucleotidase YfbR-like HD superfamily hydrolase
MDEIIETKQSELFDQMQIKLQNELQNYQESKQQFTAYLKTMDEIDEWLQNGANHENS